MQNTFHSSSQFDFGPTKTSQFDITDEGLADYQFIYCTRITSKIKDKKKQGLLKC